VANERRLRILVLSNLYPPAVIGGYEIECDTVVTHLRERQEVLVLTSRRGRREAAGERGVVRTLPFLPHRRVMKLLAPLHALRAARATRRALREFRPDVIYVWNGSMIPQVAIRIAQGAGVPVLFRVCEHWFGSLYDGEPFMGGLRTGGARAALMKAVDRLPPLRVEARAALPAAISWNSEALRRMTPVPDTVAPTIERVTLPATLQGERFIGLERRPSEEITIGFIGRVAGHKGADVAVRATALLEERYRIRARLVVAGAGDADFLRELVGLAAKLGIGDRVELVGPRDTAGLAELLSTVHAVVVPSVWEEPAGLVAVEATLARVPVVASAVGGIPEIVGDDGEVLLCRPGDPEAFAAALASTLADPAAAAVRVERAFERAQSVRLAPYLESMDRFLAEALEAAPR
jgi:glycosyltransferase involved in cell wall biosynthesis